MHDRRMLEVAAGLYNTGQYEKSREILNSLQSEEKELIKALCMLSSAMDNVEKKEWEGAKDMFLAAWKKLRMTDSKSVDVDRLKEECYTAAVAAERIILGESDGFDEFYAPKINVVG